jgi:hypothetical protein
MACPLAGLDFQLEGRKKAMKSNGGQCMAEKYHAEGGRFVPSMTDRVITTLETGCR